MSPIERVLPGLSKVRQRQAGQWSACCPAHDDNGPSLSIRETPEGAVLLHCFAGCEVADVVAALGMELHELFPPSDRPAGSPKRVAKVITASQALELLREEATYIAICAGNIAHGVVLGDDDRKRLMQAAGRVSWLRQEVMA